MPQEIIVIHDSSDLEDAVDTDDSVVVTGHSAPSTSVTHSPRLKIVHGSAVEHKSVPPPPSLASQKDFIWVTVCKCPLSLFLISCLS